jgi:ATP-binding cassette subfamily B protein
MSQSTEPESKNWRNRLSALRYVPQLFKLAWKAHFTYATTIVILRMLRAIVPVVTLWIGKLIIDTLVASSGREKDYRRLWQLLAIEIIVVLVGDLLSRASNFLEPLFTEIFNYYISEQLMVHAATLDLKHFEDPSFYDQLERARKQIGVKLGLLSEIVIVFQEFMTLISLGGVLFIYNYWLLLLIAVAVLPSFLGETYFATLEYLFVTKWTAARRELDYLIYVGTSNATAKEAQLFGFSSWLISRYRRLNQFVLDMYKRFQVRKAAVMTCLSFVGTLGYYTAYAITLIQAIEGVITLGTLTLLAGSFMKARDSFQRQLNASSYVYYQALFIKDLFAFFNMRPSITSKPGAPAVPEKISKGIVFKDLSYRYPGSDKWAVRNLSFTLRPGERIALVGENGAGKTTISKLLARLYDPTDGCILLDGRDIREYDLQSYRRAIGIIFQDYVCYDWRFDENIGIGEIEKVRLYMDSLAVVERANGKSHNHKVEVDRDTVEPLPVPSPIISAAEKSLASTLLPRLPDGYRQMLGRRFEQGIGLSGGEWQKIAIARAYMRDAQLLILDEPTSSLDARAEYEVFKRFSNLVVGRMAMIISHRFSTVRMADRILVLQNGSIIEEGTHDDLSAGGGLYAELFTLQAEGYR